MAPNADEPARSLASSQVERMVAAWQRGERPPAEEFLTSRHGIDDEAAIRLIFEETCLRQEAGMEVDRPGLARRFPGLWPELELLLDCQQLMGPGPVPADLPVAGEELAGFRLLVELGRGASGRVFLASQPALADRPVVIKGTPLGRDEHLSLARLQHMNIVPLYSAQVLPDRRLQVLCMAYLGGVSLARALDHLKGLDLARRAGSDLVEAVDRAQAGPPVTTSARGPFRRYLARSSDIEAICWVGVCLADGLQYAHERNFVHMDIKPSNVLIVGDGQPMLLDFHLAREPIAPGDTPPEHLGGTPGYMAGLGAAKPGDAPPQGGPPGRGGGRPQPGARRDGRRESPGDPSTPTWPSSTWPEATARRPSRTWASPSAPAMRPPGTRKLA